MIVQCVYVFVVIARVCAGAAAGVDAMPTNAKNKLEPEQPDGDRWRSVQHMQVVREDQDEAWAILELLGILKCRNRNRKPHGISKALLRHL